MLRNDIEKIKLKEFIHERMMNYKNSKNRKMKKSIDFNKLQNKQELKEGEYQGQGVSYGI